MLNFNFVLLAKKHLCFWYVHIYNTDHILHRGFIIDGSDAFTDNKVPTIPRINLKNKKDHLQLIIAGLFVLWLSNCPVTYLFLV